MRAPLLVAVVVAACAHPATRPASPPPSLPARPAAPTVPTVARVYHRSYSAVPDGWVDEHGDPQRAVVRGVRVELRGDDLRASDGWFAAPVQGAWERDGRWLFAARTARWESAGYLDPLRELLRAPEGGMLGLGSGRPVVIARGVAEGIGLPDGVVIDAAFGDDLHGAAILEPGTLLATDDGGRRWVPVAVDRPEQVVAVGATRWVRGTAGCSAFDEAGAARACACESLPLLRERSRGDAYFALYDRVGRLQEWQPMGFLDPAQTRLLVRYHDARGTPLRSAVYDVVRDEMVAGSAAELPCASEDVFVADRPYLVCGAADGAQVLWALEAMGWRERMRTWGCGEVLRCAVSASGARATCTGRCAADSACRVGSTFCEGTGDGAPRESGYGSLVRRWRLAGYDGETRLLVDEREWLPHAEFIAGDAAPRRLVPSPPGAGDRIADAPELGRDGLVRLWIKPTRGRGWLMLEGRPGEEFASRPLLPWMDAHDDALPPARTCGGRGLVVARAADGVTWISTARDDWRPLATGEGAGELRVPVGSPQAVEGCGPLGLATALGPGDVFGWGALRPTRFGATMDGRPETPRWSEGPTWRCAPSGASAGSERLMPREARSLGRGRSWVRRDGASLEFWLHDEATVASPAGRGWRYRAGPPDLLPAIGAHDWTVLSADARGAVVLEMGGTPPREAPVRLLAFSPDAPPRVLASFPEWALPDRYPLILTARDGAHLAAFVAPRGYSTDGAVARSGGVLAVSPGAAPRMRWATYAAETTALGVYTLEGHAGVVRIRPDGAVLGGPPGEAPRVLARATSNRACGPGARGAFTFPGGAHRSDREHGEAAFVDYALDGDALCLRRVRTDSLVVAAVANGVVGVSDEGTPLRCTPP